MSRTSSLVLSTIFSAALISSFGAMQEKARAEAAPALPSAFAVPTAAEPEGDYTIGDKLRISFLEQLDLPSQAAGGAAQKTFYQRADLTSEYTVSVDGTISMPVLGRIPVAGRDEASVHRDILSAYEQAMGRSGDVHVAIVGRQPVYVIGPVRSPGAFSYAPGMVVIQAIALAGGAERPQDSLGFVVEAGRETERSVHARTRLSSLLARRAWLEATQLGQQPTPPDDLVRLIGETNAQELISAEQRAGSAAAATRQNELTRLEQAAAAGLEEIAELQRSVQVVAEGIAAREQMIDAATQPDPRLSDTELIARLRSEIADLEMRGSQVASVIQQVEQRVAVDRAAHDKVELDFGHEVAKEIVTVTEEIIQLRETVASASGIADSIEGSTSPGAPDLFMIEIVRTTAEGPTSFAGTATTALRPGDVVRLSPRPKLAAELLL